jgi:hypothetical protein
MPSFRVRKQWGVSRIGDDICQDFPAMQHVVQLHTSSLDAEKYALNRAGVVGAR